MSELKRAAQAALDFLGRVRHWEEGQPDLHIIKVMLKAALAQPEPEPGDWPLYVAGMVGAYLGWGIDDSRIKAVAGIIGRRMWAAQPGQQAEPVGWEYVVRLLEAAGHVTSKQVLQAMQIAAAQPEQQAEHMRDALELIAAPIRPDGTWNRDRLACQQIAERALQAGKERSK